MSDGKVITLALVSVSILFPLGWVAVCHLLAAFSGWRGLAQRFGASSGLEGRHRAMWARLSWVDYRGVMDVGGDGEGGIVLSVMAPFRFGHPPLCIPLAEIQQHGERKFLWWRQARVTLPGGVGLVLPASTWRLAVHDAGGEAP
ncbi:MAG: hypothetical protein H6698_00100 [Myxococcales bacterium]|nr:hypothetical protein [Myxococcales bacterium]MCB9532713.1 hypothetical protein [Myxococcales bacterium]